VHDVDYPTNVARPRLRSECLQMPRPCPFASCKHHLFIDVGESGSVKLNFPDRDIDTLVETCSLDVADRGETTLDIIGALMNVTRERARQIEAQALSKAGPGLKHLLRDDEFLTPPGLGPALPTRAMVKVLRQLCYALAA
jgi:hypothetical protein